MAVKTSTNVGHEFRPQPESIFRNFQESILYPLPPCLDVEPRVKWKDYLTTSTQHSQNVLHEFHRKRETRFEKARLCDDVTYLKDFCEKIVRKPYSSYGANLKKYDKQSETKNEFDDKLTRAQTYTKLWEKKWKPEGNELLNDELLKFKKDVKSYSEGTGHIDYHHDPYLTTSQRVHRLFTPKEVYDGIAKQDIITIFTDMNPKPVKESDLRAIKSIVLDPPSSFLARTNPCAVDSLRRRSTCPWSHYTTACNRNASTRPRLESETQHSFNQKSLDNYEIQREYRERRNEISDVELEGYFIPDCPNMFKTESSYIGNNKPAIIV